MVLILQQGDRLVIGQHRPVQIKMNSVIIARPPLLKLAIQRLPSPRPHQLHIHRHLTILNPLNQRSRNRPIAHIPIPAWSRRHHQQIQHIRPLHYRRIRRPLFRIHPHHRCDRRQRFRQPLIHHRLPMQPLKLRRPLNFNLHRPIG